MEARQISFGFEFASYVSFVFSKHHFSYQKVWLIIPTISQDKLWEWKEEMHIKCQHIICIHVMEAVTADVIIITIYFSDSLAVFYLTHIFFLLHKHYDDKKYEAYKMTFFVYAKSQPDHKFQISVNEVFTLVISDFLKLYLDILLTFFSWASSYPAVTLLSFPDVTWWILRKLMLPSIDLFLHTKHKF